ncbi:MAG: flagellar motor protein [Thermodesulfovibrionales bacterium]
MDGASFIGLLLGITAIVGGSLFEGGEVRSILQPTAALIVFGGTLGATLLSSSMEDVWRAAASFRRIFSDEREEPEDFIDDLVRLSVKARRRGLLALEADVSGVAHPFLRKALRLAVDGMSPKAVRETMEQENMTYEEERRRVAKVFETAGGFAPTIGILGAVLGLIHVMKNLSDPSRLGAGIAVAFVATIYGVGLANLVLLPMSKKLLGRLDHELALREMFMEAVLGIQSGMNPRYLEERLRVFVRNRGEGAG